MITLAIVVMVWMLLMVLTGGWWYEAETDMWCVDTGYVVVSGTLALIAGLLLG